MNIANTKYKDAMPINTINRIRNILGEAGLLTIETNWKNSVDGFYSVSVVIAGTDLMTNGKGSTAQFALASAYGEMMERLQNFCTFRLSLDVSPEAFEYQSFYYAPDEVSLSIDDFLNSSDDWIKWQLAHLKSQQNNRELLKLWQTVSYETISSDFIALPYFNLRNGSISNIPVKMVSKMYMSNGMCAGNTPEEALVQGISEILERYVNKKVVREKVVPPTIPAEYMSQFPRLEAMITGIKTSGAFDVIMKDCSLGKGLPVVGVILVNKSDQSYFVKFGAHPVFEIAAERTLTELLQGQEIRRMMGVREFSYCNEEYNHPNNLMSILVNGSGIYPTEFFSKRFSYSFTGFPDANNNSNKSMFSSIITALFSIGCDVYIRDVSFLGFPSFHVIVPGISEIEDFDDTASIIEYAEYNKTRRYLRDIGSLDENRSLEIINFFKKTNYSSEASVLDLLNLPARIDGFPWYYSNLDLFVTAVYLRQADFANAYASFNTYLVKHETDTRSSATITYYKCLRDYIGARMEQTDRQETSELLEIFYPIDTVQGVLSEFNNLKNILTYQGYLDCWHCENCQFQNQCLYPATERVYRFLKKRYASNAPNQEALTELL